MNKVNGIILALGLMAALCGTASATQLYVDENGWWRDGGTFNTSSTPIQSAVNAADDGDSIFVYNGTYYKGGGVSITKDRITLQGEDANTTTIHGKWAAEKVVYVTADNVTVSGFTVTGTLASDAYGIYVTSADHCNILDNIVSDGDYGIYLNNSDYSIISYNNASDRKYGIYLNSCDNCLVDMNIANSNIHEDFDGGGYGIYLRHSSDNMLINNIANSNDALGIYLEYSSDNRLMNNIANSNGNGIRLYNSNNNNTLMNNIANSNIREGIFLGPSSNNNTLTNNTANLNGGYGIYLDDSNNNLMSNIANSNYIGIYLYSSSSSNTLTNNTANSNNYGIRLWSSSNNNTLVNNTANSNNYGIMLLSSCNNNTITGNIASNNNDGIHLESTSTNNNITENNITNNTQYGIYLDYSSDNEIYHNNFIDNDEQAYDHHGFNEWDNGSIIGGNYWSDHVCHGNPSDGTEPYTGIDTDAGAVDTYPFEEPDGWVTVYPPTLIYVPDDYAKIQWAVDNASVGDTIFVWNGSYVENVNVYKRLTLVGEGADVVTVTAADSGDHVFEVTVDCVNISEFAVRGATDGGAAGIRLDNVDYCNISGNNAYGNNNGIVLGGSSNNTLVSNTANSNSRGIHLDNTDNSNITCNWMQNNTQQGFYLTGGSTGNNISCNNIIENGDYNATSGGWEWQFYNDQSDAVEAKHNYWGAGMNNDTIDASIYDDEEGGWGEVEFYPFATGPVPCAPVPELPTVVLFAVGLIVLAGYARRR
jgi:parallel beta-helix repeat protein